MLDDQDKQWVNEQLKRIETRVLTEFHKYASPTGKRISGLIQAMSAHDEQIGDLEDRVRKLENRD